MDRRWLNLEFIDPSPFLVKSNALVVGSGLFKLSDWRKLLYERRVRPIVEDRRCAIFCYGLSSATGARIRFAEFESADYDYVLFVEHNGQSNFVALQMKQLPSEHLNPSATIEQQIKKLKKYADSSNLVVAIHISRNVEIDVASLDLAELPIGELWLFGQTSPESWRILGNLRSDNPCSIQFTLPKT